MNTPDTTLLNSLVSDAFSGQPTAFRPCAFFDDRMDCIRIVARDCSVLEERINERLTVLIDNYPGVGQRKYVGFTIKGAQHFCFSNKLDMKMPIKLAQLGSALLQTFRSQRL